jgi:pimeloyl-ACP methyl ester carboxylesterase
MSLASPPEAIARVGKLELCYQAIGEPGDPPLLMIMGLAAQMYWWPDGLCDLLAPRGFRLIRFDNRDCGGSSVLDPLGVPSLEAALAGADGAAPYTLSELAGDRFGAAVREARRAGLHQGTQGFPGSIGNPTFNGRCKKVISQAPRAGRRLPRGSTVSIVYAICPQAIANGHPYAPKRWRDRGAGAASGPREGGDDLLRGRVVRGVLGHVRPGDRAVRADDEHAAELGGMADRPPLDDARAPARLDSLGHDLRPEQLRRGCDLGAGRPVARALLVGEHRPLELEAAAEMGGVARRRLPDEHDPASRALQALMRAVQLHRHVAAVHSAVVAEPDQCRRAVAPVLGERVFGSLVVGEDDLSELGSVGGRVCPLPP